MTGQTPLPRVLVVTFCLSLSTGVFWHGLSFIAKHSYGFSQVRNLTLYAFMGLLYAVGAWLAGRLLRRIARWVQPRGVLATGVAMQAAAAVLPVLVAGEWALWVSAAVVTLMSAFCWPIMESYVSAGRHGPAMRSAIGWFNVTWMPATVVPMLVMAPFLEEHGTWTMAGLAAANILALIVVAWFADAPAPHDASAGAAHVAPEYPHLLRSARVLLPMSYLVSSALAPILPYLLDDKLGVAVELQTPATATWMVVRIVSMVTMWLVPFWHGRWGTLLVAGVSMGGGFVLVVLGPTVAVLMTGLAFFGAGIGMIYYAALYYAMSVGQGDVDASGTHEALIGVGYGGGPVAGLAGTALGGGIRIVAVVGVLVALGSVAAVVPYARARATRRRPPPPPS